MYSRRQPQRAILQRSAIQQQCVTRLSLAGNELVHDAHARADKFVFRALANLRQPSAVDGPLGVRQQRVARRHLHSRGGAQSRSERHVAGYIKVGAAQPVARLLQAPSHTQGIVRPIARRSVQAVETGLFCLVEVLRVQYQLAVLAGSNGRPAGKSDRGRQNKSFVVVGMFSEQVHAPGRAIDAWRRTKAGFEVREYPLLDTHATLCRPKGNCRTRVYSITILKLNRLAERSAPGRLPGYLTG